MVLEEKAAQNAMAVATKYLEETLKLTVNQQKTHLATLDEGVSFLGFIIYRNRITIQPSKIVKLKRKLKGITRRNSPVNLAKVIKDINPVLRGFVNYFQIANCKGVLRSLMAWLRRRLRAKQMKLWKKPAKLHRRLRQLGYKGEFKYIKMSSWRNSASPLASYSMPNKWFKEIGLYHPSMLETKQLLR